MILLSIFEMKPWIFMEQNTGLSLCRCQCVHFQVEKEVSQSRYLVFLLFFTYSVKIL